MGEAEKLVRTLFEVAVARQPSVIFMDEVFYSSSMLYLFYTNYDVPFRYL